MSASLVEKLAAGIGVTREEIYADVQVLKMKLGERLMRASERPVRPTRAVQYEARPRTEVHNTSIQ